MRFGMHMREHIQDVLNTRTALHDFVYMRLCLADMEQGMQIHILRERNRRSGATFLQRWIDQTMPTTDSGPWERSLNNFVPLYGNRLTDFTLSALHTMQRFIIMRVKLIHASFAVSIIPQDICKCRKVFWRGHDPAI